MAEFRANIPPGFALRLQLSMPFKRILGKVGFQGKSFHSLRHHAATTKPKETDKDVLPKKLAESLMLDKIASLLSYSNTKTTTGYVR